MTVPRIETPRLHLREFREEDFMPSAAIWADPKVVEHISGKPSTRQESWSRILRYGGLWPICGFGYWAIEERATGLFIGEAGFANFQRVIEPSLDGIPEMGWVLSSAVHGKGFASEATAAAAAWADQNLPHDKAACIITPENLASIRIAQKLGFTEWTTTHSFPKPALMFERRKKRPDA